MLIQVPFGFHFFKNWIKYKSSFVDGRLFLLGFEFSYSIHTQGYNQIPTTLDISIIRYCNVSKTKILTIPPMQPDITVLGWNILATYSEATTAKEVPFDQRHVPYNILSGTSMSCPHIAGIAALFKRANPNCSPASINCAIMTTCMYLEPIDQFQIIIL